MIKHVETVVLDSEGRSAWIAQDRKILAMFQVFHAMGVDSSSAPTPLWKSAMRE